MILTFNCRQSCIVVAQTCPLLIDCVSLISVAKHNKNMMTTNNTYLSTYFSSLLHNLSKNYKRMHLKTGVYGIAIQFIHENSIHKPTKLITYYILSQNFRLYHMYNRRIKQKPEKFYYKIFMHYIGPVRDLIDALNS